MKKVEKNGLMQRSSALLLYPAAVVLLSVSGCDKKLEKVEVMNNANNDSLIIESTSAITTDIQSPDSAAIKIPEPPKIEKEIVKIEPPKIERLVPPPPVKEIYIDPPSKSYPPDMIPVKVEKKKEYYPEVPSTREIPPSAPVPETSNPVAK